MSVSLPSVSATVRHDGYWLTRRQFSLGLSSYVCVPYGRAHLCYDIDLWSACVCECSDDWLLLSESVLCLRVLCGWECCVVESVSVLCVCCVWECDVSECCVRVVGLWCAMTVVASFIKSVLSTWVKYGRTSLSVTCACVRRMLRERRTNSLPSVSTSNSSRRSTTLTIYNYTFGMNWSYIMTNWCKTCMVCHQNWFVTFFDWHWTGFYIFLPDL